MTALGISLILAISATIAAQLWLYRREISFQKARRDWPQPRPAEQPEPRRHQAETGYAIARMRVAACATVINGLLLAAMTLGGGLSIVHAFWTGSVSFAVSAEIFTVVTIVIIHAGMHRMLTAYKQIVIDSRLGIGKITAWLFTKDTLINCGLMVVAASLLSAIVILAAAEVGTGFWVIVWLAWVCFDWLRSWLYPRMSARIFNRVREISDEVLTHRIGELMDRSGCIVDRIEVMDSSRRSTHANASVSGIGNTRRVVLFDTLLAALTKTEIVAVLAHELGHAQHLHVIKAMALKNAVAFVWIVGIGQVLAMPAIQVTLTVPAASDGELLALLWLMTPIFAIVAKPLISTMFRSFEFEADRFVIRHDDPGALQSALRKLYKKNASTKICDPLFGFVHNSHPSLDDRLDRLRTDGRQPQV